LAAGLICFGLVAGGARGAILRGTNRADLILATPQSDSINGRGGGDRIGTAWDWQPDNVRCGSGRDLVNADPKDVVAADCEVVSLQLSRDTTLDWRAVLDTAGAPSAYASRSKISCAFQGLRNSHRGL